MYETGDRNVPNSICDQNGEVCLALCYKCGKAENELTEDNCKHIWTIEKVLKFLYSRYGLSALAHSSDNYWYNLTNMTIGCILETNNEGNTTAQFCVSKAYGHFYYSKLSVDYLGKSAVDLAIKRCTQIAEAIEEL